MIRRRSVVSSLTGYAYGREGSLSDPRFAGATLLLSNELPYGPLPSVLEALQVAAHSAHRYPDPGSMLLREALCARHAVGPDQIALGSGSVEVFRQAIVAVAGPGDEVVAGDPTFPEYGTITALSGARLVAVPLRDGVHDLEAMAAEVGERTRAVVVCNPNNPTGTTVAPAQLASFVASLPEDVLVLIDEAYAEFADPALAGGAEIASRHGNVLVLRTFSKAFGLAGLRVGYGIGSPEVVATLARTRLPFGVSSLAEAAATSSLAAGEELAARVATVVSERSRVRDALVALGADTTAAEPQGNFCWLPLGERSRPVYEGLATRQVLVRPVAGGIRVTIGSPEDNDRFLEALAEVLAAGA